MNTPSTGLSTVVQPQNEALIIQGNIIQYVQNCMDCPFHKIIADPDPEDWFCDDDIAVVCGVTPNTSGSTNQSGIILENRPITIACRPYNDRKEAAVPVWCKFIKQ